LYRITGQNTRSTVAGISAVGGAGGHVGYAAVPMTFIKRYGIQLLLVLVPVAYALHWFAPEQHSAIFFAAVLAIVPLAAQMGQATEVLADRLGGGIGGLLNATFGNAAELIIGALALRAGLIDLVKASLTGSIISNVLLVFGASALVGGFRHSIQRFNRTAASLGTTMLFLSAIGLIVPAVFHWLSRLSPNPPVELELDTEIAVVLFLTYSISLLFKLKTHRELYGHAPEASAEEENGGGEHATSGNVRRAVIMLLIATVGVVLMSELLVDEVTETARRLGMSELFIGVVIVALVGNAAEHYSALIMAWQNKMDAALAIAVGSSTQIALFVSPVLLFLSYLIAPHPMDLLFSTFEIVAIVLAVIAAVFVAQDGETHWMEGVQLLAVYIILVIGFYFLPSPSAGAH
jgi:Ca2+:H+ antiporter